MLIFQPAEETASGAIAMLNDGAFKMRKPDAIYAVHTAPFQVGQVATTPGGMMASRDQLSVTISGSGNLDEIAQAVRALILSHNTVAPEMATTSVPRESIFIRMRATSAPSDDVRVIHSTVMLADATVREQLVEALSTSTQEMNTEEARLSLEYDRWIYSVTNDTTVTTRAVEIAKSILGQDNVIQLTGIVPAFSEDFGSFQEVAPGTMFFLGVSNTSKGWVGMPHSPDYVADDEAIFVGVETMGAIMLDALDVM